MIITISMLKNIFPLHTKMQNYHLSIPMCYTKCHNGDTFHLKNLLMLMNGIILAICGHDTLRPPDI